MLKSHNKIKELKEKATVIIAFFLDTVLDALIPFGLLSKTKIREWHLPAKIRFGYVVNQKFQRLQLRHRLEQSGIRNPYKIKAWWSRGLNNFGDEILAYLLARIAGADCVYDHRKHMLGIGSIIRFATNDSYVWGSGIIRQDEVMSAKPTCLAVRGPLTRQNMVAQGIPCPEIYGDPAMLFPLFFKVSSSDDVSRKMSVEGTLIVPHFKHDALILKIPGYHYQSLIVQSIDDIERIITRIATASCVVTSSLHGFIFCVAYGIPVTVFKLDSKGIGGDNIKFDDFCLGVGAERVTIHNISVLDETQIEILKEKSRVYQANWSPIPLLESLYTVCPTETLKSFTQSVKNSGCI